MYVTLCFFFFFFFNDTATTEIYTTVHTLSLHDALPICRYSARYRGSAPAFSKAACGMRPRSEEHTSELQSRTVISYAVFCLKKKKHRRGRSRRPWPPRLLRVGRSRVPSRCPRRSRPFFF